ncbi:MAG: leucine-rich repeat domain-containing protein, partial [Aristaeellaceae bacterium]
TSIGDSAFFYCTSLSSIKIPGSVTSIGVCAFNVIPDDTVLTVVPDSYAEAYAIDNGLPTDTMPTNGDYVYWVLADGTASIIRARCTEGHVVIPAELDRHPVSAIGNNAFYYRTDIHSITLPDSVTSIGDNAFNTCYNLRSVVLPRDLQQIGASAFCNCSSLHTLIIPESCTEIGKRAFPYWADDFFLAVIPGSYAEAYANEYDIPAETLLTSGGYGYRILADDTAEILLARSAEGDVVIPAELDGHAVSAIGDAAFANCTALTGAMLPDGVKAIGAFAFGGCTALGEVYIPDSVKAISKTAFQGCGDALVLRFNEGSAAVVYAIVQQIPYTYAGAGD